MRVGVDLRTVVDPAQRVADAMEADQLGLWAVMIGGAPATVALEAAEIAVKTTSIHLAIALDADSAHPHTLAEELSILDHLSQRRVLAVVAGEEVRRAHIASLLTGHVVNGVALTPPPAQTQVGVWDAAEIALVSLTGDVAADGDTIDRRRHAGDTHLFVTWPGPLMTLARHLVSRAAGPGFPSIVAEMADRLDGER